MSEDTWLSQRERGTLFAIRWTYRIATWMGRPFMRLVVSVVAFWYRLFDRRAVAASKDWLERVHGQPPNFWAVYRHLRVFAQVTLDRMFLLTGRTKSFEFTRTGQEHLSNLVASGRGAVLLGAHVGSYEAMRAGGVADDVPINILGYFKKARQINALLASLNAEHAARVIHLGDDPVGSTVKAKACVDEGQLVAILGDRVGLNDKVTEATFFGEKASFPVGPFLLASLLKCPVYLVFGLYSEPNRYDLFCEPFADDLHLPRKGRQERLQEITQRYADRVEDFCRRAPDNWFNFFDFWSKS